MGGIRVGKWTGRMPGDNRLYRTVTTTLSNDTRPASEVASWVRVWEPTGKLMARSAWVDATFP